MLSIYVQIGKICIIILEIFEYKNRINTSFEGGPRKIRNSSILYASNVGDRKHK